MNGKAICILSTIVAGIFAPAFPLAAKAPAGDTAVQTLANFPALKRLGAKKNGAIQSYLSEVAKAYRQAGYGAIGRTLPKTDDLVSLLGKPRDEVSARDLSRARAALRRLRDAIAHDEKIALPDSIGTRIPNYYALALAFAVNSNLAIKNLIAGKNSLNFLRHADDSWISRLSDEEFQVSGTLIDAMTFSVRTTGSGTLVFDSGNSYYGSGTTTLSGGSLTLSSSGSIWRYDGTFTIISISRRVAFPPGVPIPDELTGGADVTSDLTINGILIPAESKIFIVSDSFVVPEGAILIPPATFTAVSGGSLSFATPTPSPTPSPTPAN